MTPKPFPSLFRVALTVIGQLLFVAIVIVTAWVAWNMGARSGHAGHSPASALTPAPHAAHEPAPVYTCSMHPEIRQPEPGDCPLCGMELVLAEPEHTHTPSAHAAAQQAPELLGYACAMNCLPPLEEAGECPICGMIMQPIFDEPSGGATSTSPRRMTMTEEARALARIETTAVRRGPATRVVRLNGELVVDPARRVTVSANVGGRVDRLHARFAGEQVAAGTDLVELYSPELLAVQKEFLQALAASRRRDLATAEGIGAATRAAVQAGRERLRLAGLLEEQIDAIAAEGVALERVILKAPVGGTVLERPVQEGDYVAREQPVLVLGDLGTLWAELEAFESDLPWMRRGLRVSLTTRAHPGREFEGRITFIEPLARRETRTTRVRVEVSNPDGALKPAMVVTGHVQAFLPGAQPLLIPASAPLLTGTRAVVYVEIPDTDRPTYEGREVTLGPRARDGYVVAEGLAEGERVVTHGAFRIDSALQILARPSMMSPQPAPESATMQGHQH
ncbi:MAG: efflux RND transporter periplasmic adaptor subunit [Candidatus Sumerlaeia bacterium]|nr:efflux RND transporter periplasmic adaptor subunit [Candidatus Sumerlaeia bacterium]